VNIEVTVKITIKQLKNVIAEASKKKKVKAPKTLDEFAAYLEQNGFVRGKTAGVSDDEVVKYSNKAYDLTFYINYVTNNMSVNKVVKGKASIHLTNIYDALEMIEQARSLGDLGQQGTAFRYTRSFATAYNSETANARNNSFNVTRTVDGMLLFPGDIITVVDDSGGDIVWAELNGVPVQINKAAFDWRNFERVVRDIDVTKLKFRDKMGMSVSITVGRIVDIDNHRLTTEFVDGVVSTLKLAHCDIVNMMTREGTIDLDIEFDRSFDPYVMTHLIDELANDEFGDVRVWYYFKDH